MARKKERKIEIKEIEAPTSPISPLISNVFAVYSNPNIVMLDFGFAAPSYLKPYNVEDHQVARICLSWDSAENLAKDLADVISGHKRERRSQRRSKVIK